MKKYLPIIMLVLAVLVVYWGSWNIYFQQDEWSGFARAIVATNVGYGNLVRFSGSHFTPFAISTFVLLYKAFGLQPFGYAIFSLMFHAANTILMYLLANKIFTSGRIGFLAAVIFLTNDTSMQAVTWYAASSSFLPSATLTLGGLLIFEQYVKTKHAKYLALSSLLIILSAGFRENAIVVFGYFVLRLIATHSREWKRVFTVLAGVLLTYLGVRFLPVLLHTAPKVTQYASSFPIQHIISQAIRFLLFYLPRVVIPIYIPRGLITIFVGSFTSYIAPDPLIDIFYLATWVVCICIALLLKPNRLFWTLAVLLLLSVIPFSLLPPPLFMESRHFYTTSIAWALLFAWGYQRIHTTGRIKKIVATILVAIYIAMNISLIRMEIHTLQQISSVRKSLVLQLKKLYPVLPKRTLVYQSGEMMPFQSGIGHMLMVLWHDRSNYTPFLNTGFLWNMGSQEYLERDGVGFGYFTDWKLFQETYCQNNLTKENVYSFSSIGNVITDTTNLTRTSIHCEGK